MNPASLCARAESANKHRSRSSFTAAIPPQIREGVHHETQTTPPRISALLIALALTGSAGVASAATTTSSGSWLSGMELWAECIVGNPAACMAASGGSGFVTPDDPNPTITNKPN
jgi:hypothetical protein